MIVGGFLERFSIFSNFLAMNIHGQEIRKKNCNLFVGFWVDVLIIICGFWVTLLCGFFCVNFLAMVTFLIARCHVPTLY